MQSSTFSERGLALSIPHRPSAAPAPTTVGRRPPSRRSPSAVPSRRRRWRLLALSVVLALAGAVSLAPPAAGQSIVIDTFDTDQATLDLTAPADTGTSTSSSAAGAGILGGERQLQITLNSAGINGNGVSVGVASSALSYSQDPTVDASGLVQWDGADGAIALDPTGLGGVDLTAGGTQDAFFMRLIFDDTPVDAILTVYTDGANASSLNLAFPGGLFAPTNWVIPYSSFAPSLGAGADFTNVGAITLDVASVTAPDFVLDFVETTATIDTTKLDTLLIDDDMDGQVDPGDTIRYTVEVTNPDDAFNAAAGGVTFSSDVDPNTSLVVGSVTTSQGAVTTGNTAGDTSVAVDIGGLADGATVTITFDVVVDDPLPAGIDQVACQGFTSSDTIVDQPSDDPDTPAADDETVTPVDAAPLVDVVKGDTLIVDGDGSGTVNPGDTVRYTITATNGGDQDAVMVVFTSPVDPDTSLVVGSVTTSQGTVTTGNTAGDTSVAVAIGTLAGAGGTVTITFDVVVDDPLPAGVDQVACQGLLTGGNIPDTPTDDPDTPTGDDETVTPVDGAPQVDALKGDTLIVDGNGDGIVNPGDTVRYTVTVTNGGDEDGGMVVFTSPVDPDTSLVVGSVTTTQGTVTTGNTAGDTAVTVDIGTLAGGGGSVTITFDVVVDDPLPAGVDQVACQGLVTGGNIPDTATDDPDTPAADDPTTTPVEEPGTPQLEAEKTWSLVTDADGDGMVSAGDTLEYQVTLSNPGTADATNVTFDDTPDANTALVVGSVTTSQGTITSGNTAGDTAISVDVGTLSPGTPVVIVYRVTVADPLPADTVILTNQGIVGGDGIGDEPTDDPESPGDDDPTVVIVGQPTVDIPTLGEWMLLLLALMLGLVGVLRLRVV